MPILLVVLICIFCQGLMAQNPLEKILGDPQGPPGGPGPPTTPINGLIGIALAIGAYFGVRKLKKNK